MQRKPRILFVGNRFLFVPLEAALRARYALEACRSLEQAAARLSAGGYEALLVEVHSACAPSTGLQHIFGGREIEVPVVLLTDEAGRGPNNSAEALERCERVSPAGRSWQHVADLIASSIGVQKLRRENVLLRRVMQYASDCIVVADHAGRIVMANQAVALTFGYLKHELIGRPLQMLFPAAQRRGREQEMLEALRAGTAWSGQATAKRKHGNDLSLHVTLPFARDGVGESASAIMIARDVTEAQCLLGRLTQLSIIDDLTGIHNVRYFWARCRYELLRSKRYQQHLSCLMLDLDHFKAVNDRYGHRIGDEVLKHVADAVRKATREVDTVARYGGEEFVVLLPSTDLGGALVCAENIRRRVQESHLRVDGTDILVTLSVGAAALDDGVEGEEALVRRADSALIRAKQTGRNKVCAWQFPEVVTMAPQG